MRILLIFNAIFDFIAFFFCIQRLRVVHEVGFREKKVVVGFRVHFLGQIKFLQKPLWVAFVKHFQFSVTLLTTERSHLLVLGRLKSD